MKDFRFVFNLVKDHGGLEYTQKKGHGSQG